MKKMLLILLLCLPILSGCSLLKVISAPFKNQVSAVPQSTKQGKSIIKCTGELNISENGTITCSSGYYAYEQNLEIKERKLSIKEKVVQFFNNLAGISFWAIIALIFLCPSLIGLIIGRIFNATNAAFTQTVAAIKAFRQKVSVEEKEKLDAFLRAAQDEKTKQLVAAERTKVI
jgi:Trk-type K+ transport system membrane component